MGLVGFTSIFNNMPSVDFIESNLQKYSGLDINLIPNTSKTRGITSYQVILNGNPPQLFWEPEIIFQEKGAGNSSIFKVEENSIRLNGTVLDYMYDTTLENYFYGVLSAILVDIGGINDMGRKLSESVILEIWTREKWRGEIWFKKVHREPSLWEQLNKLIVKKSL